MEIYFLLCLKKRQIKNVLNLIRTKLGSLNGHVFLALNFILQCCCGCYLVCLVITVLLKHFWGRAIVEY